MNWIKPNWPAPANIHAFTSTRLGGISLSPYDSFNLALHVGDDAASVQYNRAQLKIHLALPEEPRWLTQYHSTVVLPADTVTDAPKADGSYTQTPGIVCTILTADCLPVLLCDKKGQTVAAIHAGWRGLVDGIIPETLALLAPSTYMAWLGPAISQPAYPIGEEVRELFLEKGFSQDSFQMLHHQWHMDIYSLARGQLQSLGVTEIYGGNYCTHRDKADFFSYRRDKVTGRMASLIWIND